MVDNGNLLKEVSDMDISDIFNEIDRHRPADLENGGYRNIPRKDAQKYQQLIREGEEWLIDAFNWWMDYDEVWHRGSI